MRTDADIDSPDSCRDAPERLRFHPSDRTSPPNRADERMSTVRSTCGCLQHWCVHRPGWWGEWGCTCQASPRRPTAPKRTPATPFGPHLRSRHPDRVDRWHAGGVSLDERIATASLPQHEDPAAANRRRQASRPPRWPQDPLGGSHGRRQAPPTASHRGALKRRSPPSHPGRRRARRSSPAGGWGSFSRVGSTAGAATRPRSP